MAFGYTPLFSGTVASGSTVYVGVPIHKGALGCQVAWLDATSSATVTLELTSFGAVDAPVETAGDVWLWKDSGETITGPAASAAGSLIINLGNVRQRRARLKIVAAADSEFIVHNGVSEV